MSELEINNLIKALDDVLMKHQGKHSGAGASETHDSLGPEQKPHGRRSGVGAGSKQTLAILLRAAAEHANLGEVPDFNSLVSMSDEQVWAEAAKHFGGEGGVRNVLDELPQKPGGENVNVGDITPSLIRRHLQTGATARQPFHSLGSRIPRRSGHVPAAARSADARVRPEEADKGIVDAIHGDEAEPPPAQDFDTFDELYDIAEKVNEDFHDILVGKINNHLKSLFGRTQKVVMGPIKERKTAKEKLVRKKLEWGDPVANKTHNKLGDLVRGTILVSKVEDMPKAVEAIREALKGTGWKIRGVESKYGDGPPPPWVTGATGAGYRDLSMALVSPQGLTTELQINTMAMFAAKMGEGHRLYEQIRAYDKLKGSRTPPHLTPEEAAEKRELERRSKDLYASAFSDSYGGSGGVISNAPTRDVISNTPRLGGPR